jgi:HEAT repeat protein
MNTEKTVAKVISMLANDADNDVRTALAQALSVFGAQGSSIYYVKCVFSYLYSEAFQKAFKSEKVILKLAAKLSDSDSNVRKAVQSTMLALSMQG